MSEPAEKQTESEQQPAGETRRQRRQPIFTMDNVKQYVEILNKLGENCNKANLKFAFHNHVFEFQKIEDTEELMYDILLKETDPTLTA